LLQTADNTRPRRRSDVSCFTLARATATIVPIAKDVKVQVEFNPAQVVEYRLVGYETRTLRREDSNNDKVDAGEVGSGQTVTAIYEIVSLREGKVPRRDMSGVGCLPPTEFAGRTRHEEADQRVETPPRLLTVLRLGKPLDLAESDQQDGRNAQHRKRADQHRERQAAQ
jgi:hypothetical protein